jgi:hypothetical protein
MVFESIYIAGAVATLVIARLKERGFAWYQRLPLSSHLLLAFLWPAWAALMGVCMLASAVLER